ncbi:hypothetical protein ACC697_03865 [Rhizobium ruizarguesonis]
MTPQDEVHSSNLKAALIKLDPSGPTGFEGLVAVLLGAISGQSFRLAKSGSQRGRDGDSAFDDGSIYFEAKRYSDPVRATEVKSKLADVLNDDSSQLDMWVLAATCEVGSQLARDVHLLGQRIGIYTPILDWPDTSLGMFPVAIACCASKAKRFLDDHLPASDRILLPPALAAIDHFAADPDLPDMRNNLHSYLSSSENGYRHARLRNHDWIATTLSDRVRSNSAFGQILTPLDKTKTPPLYRSQQTILAPAFTGRPDKPFFAILGDEGVGKSWLAVQSWMACSQRSILLIVTSSDVKSGEVLNDFDKFLVERLVRQSTGLASDERQRRFWHRRINGWRTNTDWDNVRVTVIVDGLNETSNAEWARILDQLALKLSELGGCLVVTTRRTHWSSVQDSLISPFVRVQLEIWALQQVAEILDSNGIKVEDIAPDVQQSLRNPRILAIALSLKESNQIEIFRELSVGRLMFEHMRQARNLGAVPLDGREFAHLLRSLAQKEIQRDQRQEQNDRRVFNALETRGLESAASCRFFEEVPTGYPLYTIRQEGLDLGLALWLITQLQLELTSGRDPAQELSRIVEPVGALDEAATMVGLATQIACIHDNVEPAVRAALVQGFVALQNVSSEDEKIFKALARHVPETFLAAAEGAYTLDYPPHRVDELLHALLDHRDRPHVETVIKSYVERWMSFVSLAPERMMHRTSSRDSQSEVDPERARRKASIDGILAELTVFEHTLFEGQLIPTTRYRYGRLQEAGLYLVAGRPLAPLVPAFARWAFSDALSASFDAPDKRFRQLIRFNPVDWEDTRAAITHEVDTLSRNTTSNVGKWARVELLRATGNIEDARAADELAEWLTRDREKFDGWSLLEKYCPVDPCDPNSERPAEFSQTADGYARIEPAGLQNSFSPGTEDRFFDMGRTSIARFETILGRDKHRAFADDVLMREGFARRQGCISILRHSSALTRGQAECFLRDGQRETAGASGEADERDAWLTAQYSLFAAIGHFDPDEQLEAISRVRGGTILLDVLAALGTPSAIKVEDVLVRVLEAEDIKAQSMAMAAVQYTRPPLTDRAKSVVKRMSTSTDAVTRSNALGLIAATADVDLLTPVADGTWTASSLDNLSGGFERWFGSSAILAAAAAGLLTVAEALDRVELGHYGFAATVNDELAIEVAKRLDVCLGIALNFQIDGELPELSFSASALSDTKPPMYSVSPRQVPNSDPLWALRPSNQTFDERQRRTTRIFDDFVTRVGKADARLIIAEITLGGLEAIVDAAPQRATEWIEQIAGLHPSSLRKIQHFAGLLAVALAARGSDVAAASIPTILTADHVFRQVEGHGRLSCHAAALWKHADTAKIGDICRSRLESLFNDGAIADEVALAFRYGREEIVFDVVDKLIASTHPAKTCRAITIAGFCDAESRAEDLLKRYATAQGYVGFAWKAASEAYKRNRWAHEWFDTMCSAATPEEFWAASVQFLKIVDVRYDGWKASTLTRSKTFKSFYPSITREMDSRISKFQDKREKTLFGEKIPPKDFAGLQESADTVL